jgi:hypothetical protein
MSVWLAFSVESSKSRTYTQDFVCRNGRKMPALVPVTSKVDLRAGINLDHRVSTFAIKRMRYLLFF